MTESVWKYPILITDHQSIPMPAGAKVLSVAMQYGQPCVWARVTPELESRPCHIRMTATGQPLPSLPLRFIGTLVPAGGALVWHVFQEER